MFILRPPVLLVTDLIYDQLYGSFRGRRMQVESSLKLFRRVKTVRIAEDAGTDVAVFAINSASENPYCVLFPYRYHREAGEYAREYSNVPAALLLGRLRDFPAQDSAVTVIRTDTEEDYFRMGRAAAVFALQDSEQEGAGPLKVLLLRDDLISPEDTEAFYRGLEAEGYSPPPIEVWSGIDYLVPGDVACAVLTGSAEFYLNQSLTIPVILFSWMDPAFTSGTVKVILDDSPWMQLIPAVKAATGGGENGGIPSKALVLGERIPEKMISRKIREIFQEIRVKL